MKRMPLSSILFVSLTILILVSIEHITINAEAAPSTTLYVGGAGPGNYTSIQAAIDNASSGDTIYVYNGTYYENIYINKSVNLVGENREGVIINGSGVGDVIFINGTNWVNISNFTITSSGSQSGDAGIEIYHSTHVHIRNVNISGNEIGIHIEYSSYNTISNNLLVANRDKAILLTGANIPSYYSNNNIISNNIVSNNLGGGIYLGPYCEKNSITGNSCTHNRYDGIQIAGSGVTQQNTIDKNNVSNNARHGIYLLSNNNTITNNICNHNGVYGIYFEGADYNYLNNNSFSYNQHGIYINTNSNNNNISDAICYSNTQAAIYLRDAQDNIIWSSICSSNFYGVVIENTTNTTIMHTKIVSNTEGVKVFGVISGVSIHYCNISHNTLYGVNNSVNVIVDAEHNWWGDSSGPYDPSNDTATGGLYNPNGQGDNVTDYVDYYPWWDSPTGAVPPEIVDNTPGFATTGDAFTFNASVTDNVGVAGVYVEYWYDAGAHTNVSMSNVAGSYWEYSIVVADTLDTLYYVISAVDGSGNWNNSGVGSVAITDNDSPVISNVQDNPDPQEYGGWVNITCSVTDNIGVNVVKVNITYPDGSYINVTMSGSYYYNASYSMLGTYSYFIWANDTSGNSAVSGIYTFTIVEYDKTPPITVCHLSGVMGKNGWYIDEVIVWLNATDDLSGVNVTYYRVDKSDWKIYTAPFIITTDKEHVISFYSIDNAGNIENVKTKTVKIDGTPPWTEIILEGNQSNGWFVSDVLLGFIAQDSCSGVKTIFYKLDDSEWSEYEDVIRVKDEGKHVVWYYAMDKAGNIETLKQATFWIDKNPPFLRIIYPTGGEIVSGSIVIKWFAEDISNLSIDIFYSNDGGTTWHLIADGLNNTGSFIWDTTTVPDGVSYLVKIYATDEAGHTNESMSNYTFIIYNNVLSLELLKPTNGIYIFDRFIFPIKNKTIIIGKITVIASASSGLGVEKVEFYIDNEAAYITYKEPYVWTWDSFAIGFYEIKVIAYDMIKEKEREIRVWIINI